MPGTWRTGRPITRAERKRRSHLAVVLLLPEDEVALQEAVVAACPATRIVDGRAQWRAQTTNRPPVRDSVLDVERTVLLWNPEIHPRLPQPRFTGGLARSPQAGRVVQWKRSVCSEDNVLANGLLMAVVWQDMDPRMLAFTSSIWRAVLRATSNYLVRWIDGTGQEQRMPTFRVGHHALAAAREGRICLNDIDEKWRLYPPSQDKARGAAL